MTWVSDETAVYTAGHRPQEASRRHSRESHVSVWGRDVEGAKGREGCYECRCDGPRGQWSGSTTTAAQVFSCLSQPKLFLSLPAPRFGGWICEAIGSCYADPMSPQLLSPGQGLGTPTRGVVERHEQRQDQRRHKQKGRNAGMGPTPAPASCSCLVLYGFIVSGLIRSEGYCLNVLCLMGKRLCS